MTSVAVFNERAKARDEILESVRDLYTLKLKLPLGNPNLKLVHTNQFLFTELPPEVFELANMEVISKALSSEYTRYSGYELNRWYIEAVTITNDKSHFEMELTLNPFATSFNKYNEEMRSFEKAFKDAFEKKTETPATNNKTKVKSVNSEDVILKNVSGFNKSDREYIKKVVNDALKNKNYPTDEVKRMKAIYKHYNSNHVYNGYDCMKKMRAYGFEGTWKRSGHNCGDGASTMVAMFRCNGLTADIMHKYGHFYVRVKCNGEWWYCDQAGDTNQHNSRYPGKGGGDRNVWHGIDSSASVVGYKYC